MAQEIIRSLFLVTVTLFVFENTEYYFFVFSNFLHHRFCLSLCIYGIILWAEVQRVFTGPMTVVIHPFRPDPTLFFLGKVIDDGVSKMLSACVRRGRINTEVNL